MSHGAEKDVARNRKALHEYAVIETYECGIVLTGTEVKSVREGGLSLADSYATVKRGEVWLLNVHIKPYSHGNRENVDPDRPRKLLLHKSEIRTLIGKTKEVGLTLVPLRVYFSAENKVKVEIALARGKKMYDKRADLAKRDAARDVERALKARQRD